MRVKYNIGFAIREIYDFLRNSKDEKALAARLLIMRQEYLQQQQK